MELLSQKLSKEESKNEVIKDQIIQTEKEWKRVHNEKIQLQDLLNRFKENTKISEGELKKNLEDIQLIDEEK